MGVANPIPGTNVMNFEIFLPKKLQKLSFLPKTKLNNATF
jgi:hypothetical protein